MASNSSKAKQMDKDGGPPGAESNDALVEMLADFLEVMTHITLFARQVYPSAIFERRQKYGVPVWMSRHPALNSYIKLVTEGAKPFLAEHSLEKFVIAIRGNKDAERMVIKLNFAFSQAVENWEDLGDSSQKLQGLQEHFRGCILKTLIIDDSQKPVIPEPSFEVFLYSRPAGASVAKDAAVYLPSLDVKKAWVTAEPGRAEISEPLILPIKSATASAAIGLEVYMESSNV